MRIGNVGSMPCTGRIGICMARRSGKDSFKVTFTSRQRDATQLAF